MDLGATILIVWMIIIVLYQFISWLCSNPETDKQIDNENKPDWVKSVHDRHNEDIAKKSSYSSVDDMPYTPQKSPVEEKIEELNQIATNHKNDITAICDKFGVKLIAEPYTANEFFIHAPSYKVEYTNYHFEVFIPCDSALSKLFQLSLELPNNTRLTIISETKNELVYLYFANHSSEYYSTCRIIFPQEGTDKNIKGTSTEACHDKVKNILYCYLNNIKLRETENKWSSIIEPREIRSSLSAMGSIDITDYAKDILLQSDYGDLFSKQVEVASENNTLFIDYELPSKDNFLSVKEYKYVATTNEITAKYYTESFIAKTYEKALYSICLRSIHEIYQVAELKQINNIVFNGFVTAINSAIGQTERTCVLSISVDRVKFEIIDIKNIDPKQCFKSLKGVSAAKLIDISPITPIITFDKNDKRFIESKQSNINEGTNLASLDWNDFEQLVRELFEQEFAQNGGEVKVTQSSRDGGVDAIAFDPDPIRGGKIIIQAKRYTNTVGVSAVRDLYGTIINEGANKGILITTSDYGSDSYNFAKGKPITLLNGGHLLYLLEKHGKRARIDIAEAKRLVNN